MRKGFSAVGQNYFLQPGFIYVTRRPAVISAVLGSCVAVCAYDRKRRMGGMNHFQYPFIRDPRVATARYGNVATLGLIRLMVEEGSQLKHLEVQIFGGAHNPSLLSRNVGRENIMAARKVLAAQRIKVVSEDVGGEKGRKLVFDTAANEVAVMKVDRLRTSDWYPYGDQR